MTRFLFVMTGTMIGVCLAIMLLGLLFVAVTVSLVILIVVVQECEALDLYTRDECIQMAGGLR